MRRLSRPAIVSSGLAACSTSGVASPSVHAAHTIVVDFRRQVSTACVNRPLSKHPAANADMDEPAPGGCSDALVAACLPCARRIHESMARGKLQHPGARPCATAGYKRGPRQPTHPHHRCGYAVMHPIFGIATADKPPTHKDWRVTCITGHSLGGSLAGLAAFDIAQQLHPQRLECYTFGAPRTGCAMHTALQETSASSHDCRVKYYS